MTKEKYELQKLESKDDLDLLVKGDNVRFSRPSDYAGVNTLYDRVEEDDTTTYKFIRRFGALDKIMLLEFYEGDLIVQGSAINNSVDRGHFKYTPDNFRDDFNSMKETLIKSGRWDN